VGGGQDGGWGGVNRERKEGRKVWRVGRGLRKTKRVREDPRLGTPNVEDIRSCRTGPSVRSESFRGLRQSLKPRK